MDSQTLRQNRYQRQTLLPQIGPAGQSKIAAARILLVGCGALGTHLAEQLVRAGVGFLRIADRDIVDLTNLQRQTLFDESDVQAGLPKAAAAARRLLSINSTIVLDARIIDVHAGNLPELAGLEGAGPPVHCILDGTDNVETRYLINDFAIKHDLPWIYGACIGTEGRVMPILPGKTPCLRCLFPTPPAPGELATCDTAGILGPAAAFVATLQATIALKLLSGNASAIAHEMIVFDLWANRLLSISAADARRADCPCCGLRQFPFLETSAADRTIALCGRNAVQIAAPAGAKLSLERLALRLESAGQVERTPFLLRCRLNDLPHVTLSCFPDGRLLIQGTQDIAIARTIASKYFGI